MNILPRGPAWAIGITTEQPLIGDITPWREQRFCVHNTSGWRIRDVMLSCYSGEITITTRHDDTNETAELVIRPFDDQTASRALESAIVRLIASLGTGSRPGILAQSEALLDRIEGACEGARAEIASTRAAQAAQELA